MARHIFFSWQSDTPSRTNRSLIEDCLKSAIEIMKADAEVDPAVRDLEIDHDTLGVPGLPPILQTIFDKIDRAAVFVSDLTYVAERKGGSKAPNPNVCIEHGYALKSMGWRRMVAVMNIASGHPDNHELPFDLRHARRPIMFHCSDTADEKQRKEIKKALVKTLVVALKAIFEDKTAGVLQPPSTSPHPHDVELLKRVRALFPTRVRHFLLNHDFGAEFRRDMLRPIAEMCEQWVDASYEFEDPILQASFAELRKTGDELLTLAALKTYPASDREFQTVKGYQDRYEFSPETSKVISELNTKATVVNEAINQFERTARKRVPIASGVHADTGKAFQ